MDEMCRVSGVMSGMLPRGLVDTVCRGTVPTRFVIWTPDSPAYGPTVPDSSRGPEMIIRTPRIDPYADAEMLISDKHAGHIVIDGIERAMTQQCCHCGGHFQVSKGSKRMRGFCTNCSQVTCGVLWCDPCVP